MASLARSSAKAGPQEAPRVERRVANLEVGILGAVEGSTAKVRNVSATGLLIHSSASISVGESLCVDLPEGGTTEVTVVWADGNIYGCEFIRPITPGVVSAAVLKSQPAELQDGTGSVAASAIVDPEQLASGTKVLIIGGLALLCWLPVLGLIAALR
jgi:hypothetical protein